MIVADKLARSVRYTKFAFIYRRLRAYTMVRLFPYVYNLELAYRFRNKRGAVVECGTWKGGTIAGIATVIGKTKQYYLFDSFEGLPDAKEIDGHAAIKYQADKNSKFYYNNCTAAEQDAREAMRIAGINNPVVIKGWFNETLPRATFEQGIAILRMDGDWYQSTMDILSNLFHQVVRGGIIIIDDYYAWEGCSKAVHDYLSQQKRSERIKAFHGICYIIKR